MPTKPTAVSKHSRGFTLIELLVVTGISALLLLTVTSMFATFLMSNVRTNLRRQVQTEGNGAMERIEFLIRNATSAACLTSPTRLSMEVNSVPYVIQLPANQIQLTIDTTNEFLTSSAVKASGFTCNATAGSPTVITLGFTIGTADGAENTLSQSFSTRTLVRNTAF